MQDLCGTREVTEIVRYTEPSAMLGGAISEVTYKWRLRDPAKWAKDPGIQEKYFTTRELNTENTPAEAKMDLVLMSDGSRYFGTIMQHTTLRDRSVPPVASTSSASIVGLLVCTVSVPEVAGLAPESRQTESRLPKQA
jgi:hypothetical protein